MCTLGILQVFDPPLFLFDPFLRLVLFVLHNLLSRPPSDFLNFFHRSLRLLLRGPVARGLGSSGLILQIATDTNRSRERAVFVHIFVNISPLTVLGVADRAVRNLLHCLHVLLDVCSALLLDLLP